MRSIDEIIIHCSATRKTWMQDRSAGEKVDEIRRWHVEENKWADIGYHYIIDTSGVVVRGRPLAKAGAHCYGKNANSIGICLIGGHGSSATDEFRDHFTPEQANALRNLLDQLQRDLPTIRKISGHNDYSSKACPGFKVDQWLNSRPPRTSVASSKTVQMSSAQMFAGLTGGISAIAALDGTVQLIVASAAIVTVIAAAIIMRERLKKWAAGIR